MRPCGWPNPRRRRHPRRGSGCRCGGRCGFLHFKRADVDPAVSYAIKTRATLIIERRRSEAWVTCIDSRTGIQKCVREGRAAVVLQRAKVGMGEDLIARTS